MNGTILNFGPLEILVIGILILLVLGPERLPELTRQMGRALRRLRETYVAFTQEFKDELQPIAKDIDEVTREIRQEVAAIRDAADLRSVLQPFTDDIARSASLNTPSTASTIATAATAATTQNGAQPAAIQPPAGQPEFNGTIAPPGSAPANLNGNGVRNSTPSRASTRSTPSLVQLADDNPWASIDVPIRSDQLDDDNPWRG